MDLRENKILNAIDEKKLMKEDEVTLKTRRIFSLLNRSIHQSQTAKFSKLKNFLL